MNERFVDCPVHLTFLSIDLSQHNIQTPNDRHDIRDHFALAHNRQGRKINKARAAEMNAVGFRAAVRSHIDAELALRRLDRHDKPRRAEH